MSSFSNSCSTGTACAVRQSVSFSTMDFVSICRKVHCTSRADRMVSLTLGSNFVGFFNVGTHEGEYYAVSSQGCRRSPGTN
jgi:hypothetical protein